MPNKSNKAKRISIFHFCAPLSSKILGHAELLYACPICGKEYPEESAKNGELTLEDVPPRSMGGTGLLLTCRTCNSKAGHKFDFYIKNQQNINDFSKMFTENNIQNSKISTGTILINNERFHISIQKKDTFTEFKLIEKTNDPRKVSELKNYFESLSANDTWKNAEFNINKTEKLDARLLKIAFLKSGFLLITAILGYSYAFDKRLSIVREQISNPENNLLSTSFFVVPNNVQTFPKRHIVLVSNPLPMFVVTFDDNAVILPNPSSPLDLYEIVEKESKISQSASFTGKLLEWPSKALMLLDIKK